MDIIDFIIGGLLANAMPHFVIGITKTKFLGLFGYSPKGNIMYALLQFIICIILITIKYSFKDIITNGFFMGPLAVMTLYFIFGKWILAFYNRESDQ